MTSRLVNEAGVAGAVRVVLLQQARNVLVCVGLLDEVFGFEAAVRPLSLNAKLVVRGALGSARTGR